MDHSEENEVNQRGGKPEEHCSRLGRLITTLTRNRAGKGSGPEIRQSDVIQGTMFKALSKLGQLKSGSAISRWLNKIADNALWDEIRIGNRGGGPPCSLDVASNESSSRVPNWAVDIQDSPIERLIYGEREDVLCKALK